MKQTVRYIEVTNEVRALLDVLNNEVVNVLMVPCWCNGKLTIDANALDLPAFAHFKAGLAGFPIVTEEIDIPIF